MRIFPLLSTNVDISPIRSFIASYLKGEQIKRKIKEGTYALLTYFLFLILFLCLLLFWGGEEIIPVFVNLFLFFFENIYNVFKLHNFMVVYFRFLDKTRLFGELVILKLKPELKKLENSL